jgi:hypothetical protein
VCDLPICDLGTICSLGKADAGWRSDDRHPGFVRFSAKLRSFAEEPDLFFAFVISPLLVPPHTLFSHHLHR